MSDLGDEFNLRIITQTTAVEVVAEGEMTEHNAGEFESRIGAINLEAPCDVILDLSRMDIEDGIALATAVNAIRRLRPHAARIIIKGAPQMLGHNLYRVGLLEGKSPIELVDMRADEPAGY